MAVESRFVVIRNGVEVETFMDKKTADEYDKMLDMADNLSVILEQSPIELSEQAAEDLSVFLAKNREDVLVALQAKKPKPAAKPAAKAEESVEEKAEPKTADKPVAAKAATGKAPAKTTRARSKAKAS